eukprot:TRINITY_DN2414_c0_g1_i1.p2 TRINITY_DN2414_c0_g1~~TRINITY_DN2414_c0_g1_i1.p2  ORF type:complete len:128 (-),score=7.73 TRINITY_DN2414_c0_g1_i1:37-420(-)
MYAAPQTGGGGSGGVPSSIATHARHTRSTQPVCGSQRRLAPQRLQNRPPQARQWWRRQRSRKRRAQCSHAAPSASGFHRGTSPGFTGTIVNADAAGVTEKEYIACFREQVEGLCDASDFHADISEKK